MSVELCNCARCNKPGEPAVRMIVAFSGARVEVAICWHCIAEIMFAQKSEAASA